MPEELETLYSHLREADRLAQGGDKQAEQDARKIYAEIQRIENLQSTGQENVGIKQKTTPFGVEYAPEGGALIGGTLGAAFGPQISKSIVAPIEEITPSVSGKSPSSAVKNYIKGSTDMDYAGGKDYGTAYRKAEIASGKPVESRGSKIPLRKGNLSIQNQPTTFDKIKSEVALNKPAGSLGRFGAGAKLGASGELIGKAIKEGYGGQYGDAASDLSQGLLALAGLSHNKPLRWIGNAIAGKEMYQGLSPFFTQPVAPAEQKAAGGMVGYAGGKKVIQGGLEAAKKLFDPRFDKRVLEQEKLHNLKTHTEPTGVTDIPKIYLPDYEGQGFVTSMSDRTDSGSRLLGINDVMFNRPVDLNTGKKFMYNNPDMAWASGKLPVNQIMKEAVELKRATGKDPLYLPWRMAPSASDFAHATGETMLAHADSALGAAQKKDLNNLIKKFIPDWKGVENPESITQFHGAPANARKSIQSAIDRDLRDSGALSIGETRLAIADPTQLAAPEGGVSHVARIFADKPVIQKSGSVTYPFGVPGEGVGQLNRDHIVTEMLPKLASERSIVDVRNPNAQDLRALQMKPYSGIFTDKLLKSLGYADGGQIEGYAAGKKVAQSALGFFKPAAKSHSQDPVVARALEDYLKGNISQEERMAIMNKQMPLRPWTTLPPAYSDEQIKMALMENKRPKALVDVPAGMRVGNRLDIPAYVQNGVYVDTTHNLAGSNSPISYNRTGHLKDVEFSSKPNQAVRVGLGTKEQALTPMGAEMGAAKSPFAMIKGTNVGTSDEEVRRMMQEYLNDPNWAQVGMDPRRHSQFYDKATGMPVWSAEEKLQSGPLVLVPKRGLETTTWDDPRLNLTDFPGKKYAEGGSTTPAWQRKEGKNPEGGLNAVGRASYNRETGGNLKAPQPEGGPRKKSFCARMEGMKKKLTSSETANDPDSRINKSLRKWKC